MGMMGLLGSWWGKWTEVEVLLVNLVSVLSHPCLSGHFVKPMGQT